MIYGLYNYDIPPAICSGTPGILLELLPDRYEDYENPERIEFLVVRQGLVTLRLLEAFPSVKWIQLLNSGYEMVNLQLLKERNIILTNARSVYGKTIAEDVITKMLVLARRYIKQIHMQEQHLWDEVGGQLDLFGKTLGILGAGNIGKEIAVRAKAFEMTVHGYDPFVSSQTGFDRIYQSIGDLPALLSNSDYVVLCLPVTQETRGFMNASKFSQMKPGATFINVSRGEVVDEASLIEALEQGIIKNAAIDVCMNEPLDADSPLWSVKNLLITPHQAAFGDLTNVRMCALIEKNLQRYVSQDTLLDRVL